MVQLTYDTEILLQWLDGNFQIHLFPKELLSWTTDIIRNGWTCNGIVGIAFVIGIEIEGTSCEPTNRV